MPGLLLVLTLAAPQSPAEGDGPPVVPVESVWSAGLPELIPPGSGVRFKFLTKHSANVGDLQALVLSPAAFSAVRELGDLQSTTAGDYHEVLACGRGRLSYRFEGRVIHVPLIRLGEVAESAAAYDARVSPAPTEASPAEPETFAEDAAETEFAEPLSEAAE